MGQFCETQISKHPQGIPTDNTGINLQGNLQLEKRFQSDSPFSSLSTAVTARLQELNYQPLQLQSILKHPFLQLPNGVCFQGQIQSNKMHGIGRLAIPDGSYYQGEMVHNQPNGKGLLIDSKGQFYVGNFKNNRAEGKGMYVGDDFIYEGNFKQNLFSGQGKLTKKDEIFEGIFQKGKMKKGKLTKLGDNSVYEGQFQGNIQNGYGKSSKDNITYEGIFKNGLIEGEGKMIQKNGDQLICMFEKGSIVSVIKASTPPQQGTSPQLEQQSNIRIHLPQ